MLGLLLVQQGILPENHPIVLTEHFLHPRFFCRQHHLLCGIVKPFMTFDVICVDNAQHVSSQLPLLGHIRRGIDFNIIQTGSNRSHMRLIMSRTDCDWYISRI